MFSKFVLDDLLVLVMILLALLVKLNHGALKRNGLSGMFLKIIAKNSCEILNYIFIEGCM